MKRLEKITGGRVIPGHDEKVFLALQKDGPSFT